MDQKKQFDVRVIALTGILAAMVFVLTKFASIPIPSPLGKTALSLGNTMCILAGSSRSTRALPTPGRANFGSPSSINS